MKKEIILIIVGVLITINLFSQSQDDSIYKVAWKQFNSYNYKKSAELFEKCIEIEKDSIDAILYLNAASAWAYENNKEKVFYYLNKLPQANFLEKNFILYNFGEFYKYQSTKDWEQLMGIFIQKQDQFYDYASTVDWQVLSMEQMYQDFDTLVSILTSVSPHINVREKVCEVNYENYFLKLREKINFCQSSKDFALILKQALISCQDGHTSLTELNSFSLLSSGHSKEYCASIAKYSMLFRSKIINGKNLPKLIYYKGQYYFTEDYQYQNIIINKKSKLLKVNGMLPSDYIIENIGRIRNLSWDFENKCFYKDDFLSLNIATNDISVELQVESNGKNTTIVIPYIIGIERDKTIKADNGFVWYWKNEKVLYIKMPRMTNGPYYVEKILKFKDKTVEKVVIDIRNNPGGSDYDWYDVLESIYSESNLPKIIIGYNANNPKIKNNTEYAEYDKMPDLNLVCETSISGYKTENRDNIKYKDKIYILYNQYTFSAAGSLVNLCYYSDKLISIGEKTGKIIGFGIMPEVYQLPNTKLKFRVAPVLDITNSENYKDIFHDKPEIPVNLNLDEKILLKNTKHITIDFLKKQDPYMKKVISLKNN